MASLPRYPLFQALAQHDPKSTAVVHCKSRRRFTYGQLLSDVSTKAQELAVATKRDQSSLRGERVALLIENSYDYVVHLLSVMASDAIAVPLSPAFPASELRYVLDHSEALALLSSQKFATKATETLKEGLERLPVHVVAEKGVSSTTESSTSPSFRDINPAHEGGIMLYTSGTTSRPKGVLLPTSTLNAQSQSLHEAWSYTSSDHLLHVLPLHHIHGVVNAILTPLLAGSTIEFLYPFAPDTVWTRLAAPFLPQTDTTTTTLEPITFFTAVPTVYSRLLSTHPTLPSSTVDALTQALSRSSLRLNISGSAALPTPTKTAWSALTNGNTLLERYGMTEVGMALSCGLSDHDRIDGSVGWPLPGVQARLVSDDGTTLAAPTATNPSPVRGAIQLKGPTIFHSYWRNASATAAEFTADGWFKTGDVGEQRLVPDAGTGESGSWAQGPAWFILGRASADIIKTGGEKISALEVERELLSLPEIREAVVVGLPSVAWGQKVAAVVVLNHDTPNGIGAWQQGTRKLSVLDLRRKLKDRLVAYKIPQDLLVVEAIPRNAMGKVNKKELIKVLFGNETRIRRRSVLEKVEREALKREEAERVEGEAFQK